MESEKKEKKEEGERGKECGVVCLQTDEGRQR